MARDLLMVAPMRLAAPVVLAASLGLLAPARVASAQPSLAPTAVRPKTPARAAVISLGVTVGSLVVTAMGYRVADSSGSAAGPGLLVLGAAGLYLGPSTGHWYAGEVGTLGLVARATGAAMVVGSFLYGPSPDGCPPPISPECAAADRDARRRADISEPVLLAGLALWLGSSVYDLVTAPRAARRWNRARGLDLAPSLVPTPQGPVLGVSGRF